MNLVTDARRRPRRAPRVRRDPIDVASLDIPALDTAATEPRREEEILAALEAEVERVHRARAASAPQFPVPAPTRTPVAVATPARVPVPSQVRIPIATVRASAPARTVAGANDVGLPLDQVRAWLEQVKDDLRKVQARVEHLEVEHTRLQDQHHLVTELISSSTPV